MMNIEIKNKENKIACTITSLEFSDTRCGTRIFMDTKRVRTLLSEQGYNPGLLIKDSRVDNCDGNLYGTWVFEDANAVKPMMEVVVEKIEEEAKTTTSRKRRNSRKSKKVLDKSVEDVIIEE